ncbi:hypothetical protein EVAR_41587_1 [Eumeta japonica]|uniref:Uncharacterized protein n=1 Tax=Eumeta variegata TaxID=151549 RepID=A0A4C1Y6I1_EUMVA|nr:hypothetical protein EVAR_41587_1 [Eumeta japonica]
MNRNNLPREEITPPRGKLGRRRAKLVCPRTLSLRGKQNRDSPVALTPNCVSTSLGIFVCHVHIIRIRLRP